MHAGPFGVKSQTFPKQTPFSVMAAWREEQRTLHHDEPQTLIVPKRSGFAKDAAEYLKAVRSMASYDDRERDINAWVAAFGDRNRRTITPVDIRTQLETWSQGNTSKGTPPSASLLNHRLTALQNLFTVLDGKLARNPAKEVPKFREPEPKARAVDYGIIQAILDAMPACKTKARLEVLAYTGIPPSSIMRITQEDLNLDASSVYLRGRQKGKGTKGKWRKLTKQGVQAFRSFIAADAFGPYSDGSLHQVFVRARDKVAKALGVSLDHIRPYDFRHSFGSRVLEVTGDLKATQKLMGHSDPKTTERYTLAAVDVRVDLAIAALDDAE